MNNVLTPELQARVVGHLLGDMRAATNRKDRSTFHLRFVQQDSHKDYVLDTFEAFRPYCSQQEIKQQKNLSWYFITRQLEVFSYLGRLFYPIHEKVVPKNIGDLLTDRGLAYWFMDDGSQMNSLRGIYFATQSFTEEDVLLLIKCLNDKFQLKATIQQI